LESVGDCRNADQPVENDDRCEQASAKSCRPLHRQQQRSDGRGDEKLERNEGKIQSESGKANDMKTVAITGASGGLIGAGLGSQVGSMGEGAAIGAGAGVAAGVMMAMLSRGPEATLPKGSTIEMVLDRQLTFNGEEVDFRNAAQPTNFTDGAGPTPAQKSGSGAPGLRRLPI